MIKRFLFFLLSGRLLASSLASYYSDTETDSHRFYEQGTFFSVTTPITFQYLGEDAIWTKKIPPEQNDNFVYGAARYEIGIPMDNNWSFGIIDIAEAWLNSNADFINAYSALKTGELALYEKDRTYRVHAKGEYYKVQGVFLQKSFHYDNHTLTIRSKLLDGKEYMDLNLNGWIHDDTSSGLAFDLEVAHHYFKKNLLTERKTNSNLFQGNGLAHDLTYRYEEKGTFFEAGCKNLFGYVHWDNIPNYKAKANSNTKYLGEDNYYHYRPVLSGNYMTTRTIHQTLPLHTYALLGETIGEYTVSALGYRFKTYESTQLMVRKAQYELAHEIEYNRSEITYYGKRFTLSLSFSLLDQDNAHSLAGSFTLYHK